MSYMAKSGTHKGTRRVINEAHCGRVWPFARLGMGRKDGLGRKARAFLGRI
jgi:hypothetical protein